MAEILMRHLIQSLRCHTGFQTILSRENQYTMVEVPKVRWGKGTHALFSLQVSGRLPDLLQTERIFFQGQMSPEAFIELFLELLFL